jgi:hypothetical protein
MNYNKDIINKILNNKNRTDIVIQIKNTDFPSSKDFKIGTDYNAYIDDDLYITNDLQRKLCIDPFNNGSYSHIYYVNTNNILNSKDNFDYHFIFKHVKCAPGTEILQESDLRNKPYKYLGRKKDRIDTIVNLKIDKNKKIFKVNKISSNDAPIQNNSGQNINEFVLSGDVHNLLCKLNINQGQIRPVSPVTQIRPVSPVTQIRQVSPVSPVTQMRPVSPVSPVTQMRPVSPVSPVTQMRPVPQMRPVSPVSPVTQMRPVSPVSPVTQMRPVSPVSPVTQMRPVSPVTQIRPVSPVTQIRSVTPAPQVPQPSEVSPTIQFIETELKRLFNINIKLQTYQLMKSNFNLDSILPIRIIYESTNIQYNKNTYIKDTSTRVVACGSSNCVEYYILDNKKYVFRKTLSPVISDDIFESFYENLKHFILYVIIINYFKKIKIIPKPIGMGLYKSNSSNYFGMLMEGGNNSVEDFFNININKIQNSNSNSNLKRSFFKILEGICATIYKDLYILNSRPEILQFKHNDLKSLNIILLNKNPLLIDFGLSCFKIMGIDFICPHLIEYRSTRLQNNPYINVIYDMITLIYFMYQFLNPKFTSSDILNNFFNIDESFILSKKLVDIYIQNEPNLSSRMFIFFKICSDNFKTQYQILSEIIVRTMEVLNTNFILSKDFIPTSQNKQKYINSVIINPPNLLFNKLGITSLKQIEKFKYKYLKYKNKYLKLQAEAEAKYI